MDTKTHIQEVAIDLFSKKGYHSTSIRDIAIEAKLNSSMVSYYFQSKENLYISLFKTFEVDYLKEFDDHSIFQTEDEALKKFISNSIEFGAKNKKMSILIFSEQIFRTSFTIKNIIASIDKPHLHTFINIKSNPNPPLGLELEVMRWQYFTFFLNLKNALVASCNNQNDTDNVRYIGSLDFIKKSVELIFNLDGNVKVAL